MACRISSSKPEPSARATAVSPRSILWKTLEQRELLALSEQIEAASVRFMPFRSIADSVSEYDGDGKV